MVNRSVLIPGGTGGLGEAVLTTFVADGWRVVAPVRPGSTAKLPDGVTRIESDVFLAGDGSAPTSGATIPVSGRS